MTKLEMTTEGDLVVTEDFKFHFEPHCELNLHFYQENQEVGKFWFDREDKQWRFEGDKAKSATEFVAWVLISFRQQLKEEYGLIAIQKLVDEQAEDEGLWFHAETAPEAYLQQELRRLHRVIEGETENESTG